MSGLPSTAGTAPVHPIQVVTRRTGLSADLVRVWEKRYGAVAPARTPTARRLYSDDDIERLRLLAEATLTGRTIGQVATLSTEALTALVRDARGPTTPAVHARADEPPADASPAPVRADDHLHACVHAVERFDGVDLDLLLRRATVALSAEAFLDAVALPLATGVAERVRDGTLRSAHRHLALAVLRRVLAHVTAAATAPNAASSLVVATPSGQPQELPALVAAAAAAAEGWRVVYLGPEVPAEDLADAAAHAGAAAVVLSLGGAPGDRATPHELRRLRDALPSGVVILVDGAATDRHRAVLGEIGASAIADLRALRAQLRRLHDA
jgi:DNA-binding transcriptional MerR regulator/methylmalonyl-CoA mutase cobalamin-binding subunit